MAIGRARSWLSESITRGTSLSPLEDGITNTPRHRLRFNNAELRFAVGAPDGHRIAGWVHLEHRWAHYCCNTSRPVDKGKVTGVAGVGISCEAARPQLWLVVRKRLRPFVIGNETVLAGLYAMSNLRPSASAAARFDGRTYNAAM